MEYPAEPHGASLSQVRRRLAQAWRLMARLADYRGVGRRCGESNSSSTTFLLRGENLRPAAQLLRAAGLAFQDDRSRRSSIAVKHLRNDGSEPDSYVAATLCRPGFWQIAGSIPSTRCRGTILAADVEIARDVRRARHVCRGCVRRHLNLSAPNGSQRMPFLSLGLQELQWASRPAANPARPRALRRRLPGPGRHHPARAASDDQCEGRSSPRCART